LKDLVGLFCSGSDPTLLEEEIELVNSNTGSFASAATLKCATGQRVNAFQFGFGEMN
jgi:hypothetical protein